jgi:hypothetical protein
MNDFNDDYNGPNPTDLRLVVGFIEHNWSAFVAYLENDEATAKAVLEELSRWELGS